MSEGYICDRCREKSTSGKIPWHQTVKHDGKVYELDDLCVTELNRWMNGGTHLGVLAKGEDGEPLVSDRNLPQERNPLKKLKEGLSVCARDRNIDYIPTHQYIKRGHVGKVEPLCRDCWEEYRSWFHAGINKQGSDQSA